MSTPLVLLHGFTGSPSSWTDVRIGLERDLYDDNVFAPALLGHDGSPGPAEVQSFGDEVDRLARAVLERRMERPHLVGYSMGARVGLGLLVRHPGLFLSATLIGVSPGPADPAERSSRRDQDEGWARLLETEGLDTFVAAWEALPLFAAQQRGDPVRLARQRRIRLSHDPRGLARALRVIGPAAMPDYRPELGLVDVPVRIVAGERDRKFVGLGRELAPRLPAGQLRIVGDAGHNVVLERPAEIARLLKEQGS